MRIQIIFKRVADGCELADGVLSYLYIAVELGYDVMKGTILCRYK